MDLIHIPGQQWDNTVQSIGWDEKRIRELKVMVVGAGALGNEVLKNLALLNVGHILIVDYDHIEYANLAKSVLFREADCGPDKLKCEVAAAKVKEINPQVAVQALNGDIGTDVGLGIFRQMDVVIGCLDNRIARWRLNRQCFHVDKSWVDGAIHNLSGQLTVFRPGIACYECNLSEEEREWIEEQLSCFAVAQANYSLGRIPTTPISSSIIAAMEVQEALKIAMGNDAFSMAGKRFYYDGMTNTVELFGIEPPEPGCYSHFRYDPIIEAEELTAEMSLEDLLAWLKGHFGTDDVAIYLDSELILEIITKHTQRKIPVIMPASKFKEKNVAHYKEHIDDEIRISSQADKVLTYLDDTFPYLDKSLLELGIPPYHILRVIANKQATFVELSGDRSVLHFQ